MTPMPRGTQAIKQHGRSCISVASHAFLPRPAKTGVPKYLKFNMLNKVQQSLLIDRNSFKSQPCPLLPSTPGTNWNATEITLTI